MSATTLQTLLQEKGVEVLFNHDTNHDVISFIYNGVSETKETMDNIVLSQFPNHVIDSMIDNGIYKGNAVPNV